MNNWTWTDDYSIAYRESDDPRILEVIQRDTDSCAPDGDAYAPAYFLEYRAGWSFNRAGGTFDDEDAMEAYVNARSNFSGHDIVERFMKIFLDTTVEEVSLSVGPVTVILLNTPAYRQHIGIDSPDGTRALNGAGDPIADEVAYSLDGDVETWKHYLDGDVFGVGHAVYEARTSHDIPIDLDDFEIEIECWGFYGEEYAQESADNFDWPALHPMLDIPA